MANFFELVCVSAVFLATASASTQDRRSYFKPGGELVLRPVGVTTINSVSWKKGSYVVAEFVKDAIPVTYYGKFKGRTQLDTNTGRLRISNATDADKGEYKLELNGTIQEEPYEAKFPAEVPKPVVRVYPIACDHNDDECTVGCEGNVSEVGDVTYSWKLGNGDWEEREKTVQLLNNATIQAVEQLSCRIENLLGSKESEAVDNPLYRKNPPGLIVGIIIGVILLLGLPVGGYFLYKKYNSTRESFPVDVNGVSTHEEMSPFRPAGEGTEPANRESSAAATPTEVSPEAPGEDTPAST